MLDPNQITKIFLSALGRQPLAAVPDLRLYLPFETAPVALPALVATCSLAAREPHGNATADVEANFTLALNAADYESDDVEEMTLALGDVLAGLDADTLNVHAEALGVAAHFYFFRWSSTEAPSAEADGVLSFNFTFTGATQL